MWQIKLTIR